MLQHTCSRIRRDVLAALPAAAAAGALSTPSDNPSSNLPALVQLLVAMRATLCMPCSAQVQNLHGQHSICTNAPVPVSGGMRMLHCQQLLPLLRCRRPATAHPARALAGAALAAGPAAAREGGAAAAVCSPSCRCKSRTEPGKTSSSWAVALMKYGSRIMFFFCGEAVLPSLTVWWNQV